MGKVVKAIVIGAIIGLIGYFVLPVIGLSTPFAGLFKLGNLAAAVVGGAITGGLSSLLAPSFNIDRTTRSRLNISVDPEAAGKWVFGRTAAATDVVFAAQHGAGRYVSHIIAAAAHEIESFDTFWAKDDLVLFTGALATGAWASAVAKQQNPGTDTQTAFLNIGADDAFAVTHWPTAARGLGMAHYRVRWSVQSNRIASGIPSRITQQVRGCKVYDPRLDTTRGGAGLHRADDQSTWEWSNGGANIGENWALLCAFYLLGWRSNGSLIFGVGVDPDDIDWAQCVSAANTCQEIVDGIWRFRVGGILPTSNNHEDIIRALESMINGKISQVGGMYYIWAPNNDLTIFSNITEDDLIRDVGVDFEPSGPIEKLYNTARGRFISPDDLYQPLPYPEIVEPAAVVEDGRERILSYDFGGIQDSSIAERVARHIVRRSRFGATWSFAMGPKGLTFRPFSVTTLNIQETNFQDVTVRVLSQTFSASGLVLMEVIEEDASIYDTSLPLGTPITTNTPALVDPTLEVAVSNLVVTATSVQGSNGTASPAFQLSWDDPGTWIDRTEIQIKESSSAIWTIIAPARVDFLQTVITSIEPGTLYDVRARHINIHQVPGAWVQVSGTSVSISVGSGLSEVPNFTPGHIGGSSNFVYSLNTNWSGSSNIGEIRVHGTIFNHPDGTVITTSSNPFQINTPYEGGTIGRFYLMYSAVNGETRFGGIVNNWGDPSNGDTRFIVVTWDLALGWRARDNVGAYFAFVPLATDAIIAVVDKIATSGGINSIIPLNSGIVGNDAKLLVGDPSISNGASSWDVSAPQTSYSVGAGLIGDAILMGTSFGAGSQFYAAARRGPTVFDAESAGIMSIEIRWRVKLNTTPIGIWSQSVLPRIRLTALNEGSQSLYTGTSQISFSNASTAGVWFDDSAIIEVADTGTPPRYIQIGLLTANNANGPEFAVDALQATIIGAPFAGAGKPGVVSAPATSVGFALKDDGTFGNVAVLDVSDTRAVDDAPDDFNRIARFDFKQRIVVGFPGDDAFGGVLTFAPWQDTSGGPNYQIALSNFADDPLMAIRAGDHGASPANWGSWVRMAQQGSAINTQNGNYTLVLADADKTIRKATSTASITHTIPANASVAFNIGTMVAFRNSGTVNMTIAITTDVLTGTDGSTGPRTLGPNQVAVAHKVAATSWEYAASDL